MGKLKPSNIFALTPGGTMGMPTREVNAGKFDKPGVMGGMMTMEEMMGMKMADMPMDAGMSMGGGMKGMDHGATKMDGIDRVGMTGESAPPANPHYGKKHMWDYVPFGPDIASRKPLVMDGMGKRPGPPYQDLRSTKNTGLPTKNPMREVRLTLDGDMERYVWTLNNTPLFSSDSIKIGRGENVRFIMINRTMMHHPMHLHGHFFRIVNGQGNHASLKHTVDVPPMETTVIEFEADEVGDCFFTAIYSTTSKRHGPRGALRRLFAVSGHGRHLPQALPDPLFVWGTADIMSNMTQGYLELSNTQNILNLEWEAGWANVPDTEWETTFLYERYFNRFFRLIAGVNTEGTVTTGPLEFDVESNRGVFGFMYKLPLNVDTTAWADTDGGARVKAAKSIPLTPRLHLGGELEFDTHDGWKGRVHLDYMLHKNAAIISQWHSDYGWGVGWRVRF